MSVPHGNLKDEPIDVDGEPDVDVLCTGILHCVRIDRASSPRPKKRMSGPLTINLIDSDDEDIKIASSSQVTLEQYNSNHSRSQVKHPLLVNTELQRVTQRELKCRAAIHKIQPADKRTSDALRMAEDAVKRHRKSNPKQHIQDVIVLSSDSETEVRPPKRQKVEGSVGSPHVMHRISEPHDERPNLEAESFHAEPRSPSLFDWHHSDGEDEDCIDFLTSLDISNETNWKPLPTRNRAEDLTPLHEADLSKPQISAPFRIPRKKPPIDDNRVPLNWRATGLWGMISRIHGITRFPKPTFHAQRQERLFPLRPPSLYYAQGYTKLSLAAKYPHLMSGPVNKIVQNQGNVVFCASADGGLEESDDEDAERPPPRPENRSGSLVVYHNGRVNVIPAHCRRRDYQRGTSRSSIMKYYAVNDVVFNPLNPRQFLSSGCDLVVQGWEILDTDDDQERESVRRIRGVTFDYRPQELVFAPDGSALAITCYDGTVWLYTQKLFEDIVDPPFKPKPFYVTAKENNHAAGSTLWGKGPSATLLFSSSEPWNKDEYRGFHRAFDTCRGTRALQFDAPGAGDAAALSPDGTILALFTRGRDRTHPVHFYDVRRQVKDAYETEELEKFRSRPSVVSGQESDDPIEEVNQASFSSDGHLLAVARSDNIIHVYDMRALSRGPLCRFEHHDSDAVGGGGYGVVAANWMSSRGKIGIVSGGNDGCVRLWEPALGSTDSIQGAVLGRTDFDVGYFSVGNWQDGEFPLIIGDSGGGVHTYHFTNEEGIRI
ncbi:WD40-repeat-containing domain protein [Chiua virens]|nr:WD40-repeat-containing domain protein [Chiua virens]